MRDEIQNLFENPESSFHTIAMRGRNARPRIAQVDYAIAVTEALERSGTDVSVALLQADTGIGKSHGYLVPTVLHAARTGGRVVVSTQTIALQKQIMGSMPGVIDMVEAETGRRLKAARRIGKRNFLSMEKLDELIADNAGEISSGLAVLLDDVRVAIYEGRGTLQEIVDEFGSDLRAHEDMPFSIESCRLGHGSTDDGAYRKMIEDSREADVLVINHALLTLDIMTGGRILGTADDDRKVTYIVDEADAFPDIVRSMLSRRLPFSALSNILEHAKACGAQGTKILSKHISMLIDLERQVQSNFMHKRFPGGDRKADILPIDKSFDAPWKRNFSTCLAGLEKGIRKIEKSSVSEPALAEGVTAALHDIVAIREALNYVVSGNQLPVLPALYWTPARKNPGLLVTGGSPEAITSNLWRRETMKANAVIMTSATLSASGGEVGADMVDFSIRIGLSRKLQAAAITGEFAPARFGHMDFVIADQSTAPRISLHRQVADDDDTDEDSVETNPEAVLWWAGMIRAAAAENNGRILVLPTSYKDARLIFEALGEVDGYEVFIDAPGQSDTVERFKGNNRSIMIAPGKWFGLDLPGMIRHIVIPRIPFAPPDIVHNALFEEFLKKTTGNETKAKQHRFSTSVVNAIRKMRQALGRGVRDDEDRVTIWIGDGRWPTFRRRTKANLVHAANLKPVGPMRRAIPYRFQEAFEEADGFDPVRGRFTYVSAFQAGVKEDA